MHGFFVDLRLYEKAKAISNPFAYEEYLEEQRKSKLEAERASRIKAGSSLLNKTATTAGKEKKTPIVHGSKAKVNTILAERLSQQSELLAKLEAMEREAEQATANPADSDSEVDAQPTKTLTKADKKALKAAKSSQAILQDDRFASLFTNPEFAIDEDTIDYQNVQKKLQNDD